MSRVEEPRYTVVESLGRIEVRAYGPLTVAETQVSGIRKEAIQQGFRNIASYIFGGNRSAQKIAMTAPVIQQQTEATVQSVESREAQHWIVRFVMPASFTLDTLPAPSDSRVNLTSTNSRRYAVIRFSGTSSDQNIQKHLAILREESAAHNLNIVGQPVMAFYNPPWTLPFLRRNEIWLEIATSMER